jgi:hypothetical protein
MAQRGHAHVTDDYRLIVVLLIKEHMPMVNQEWNHVNHFNETKSTSGSKKSMQPYQIALKL